MIKPQHFVVIAGATIVAVAWAAYLNSSANQRTAGGVEGRAMLPELARQASSLGSIEFTKGDDKLTLERAGEQWKLKERGGYPVLADKVRALVVQLADAKLVEAKTAAKDRWSLLELEDPQDKDAKSALVRLLDAHGKPISEMIIGKTHPNAFGTGRGGIYVRRPGETQTWLASGEPSVTLDVKDWVDTAIYKADVPKFKRVTVEHANEVPIVVEKGSEPNAKFALKSVPEGVKVKPNAPVDQIALGFSSIDLEDVRKLDTTPIGETVSVITTESTDGLTVTFRLRREATPAAAWLSFTASGTGDAKKAADEINAKAAGWEFKIPDWKANQIGKRAADLFETS
ncbi:MAG: DUF4340 domain-containing protein [Hyphomicrobiaceae bacterium]